MKYANKFKYLFFIGLFGLISFGLFNFPKQVKAENTIVYEQTLVDQKNMGYGGYVGVKFTATSTNISAFDLFLSSNTSGEKSFHWYICDNPTGNDTNNFVAPCDNGTILNEGTSTFNIINDSGTQIGGSGYYFNWYQFDITDTNLTVGNQYGFIVNYLGQYMMTGFYDYGDISGNYQPLGTQIFNNREMTFRTYKSEIQSTNYLDYFGENPFYAPTNDYTDLWVQYDICDGYNATSTYALVAEIDPGGENAIWYGIEKNFNSGCSGVYDLRVPTGSEEITGTAYITLYKDYVDEIDYGETVATSENFLGTIYKPITQENGYIYPLLTNNTLNINTDTASSGTINFSYNVCTDSGYSSTTRKFYLDTAGNNETTSLNSASTTILTCKGTSTITIQNSTSTPYNLDWLADIKYVNTNNYNTIYKSEPFKIHWFTYLISTPETIQGINARDLACSAEEWASSEESWFNWTKLKCLTFQTALSIAFKITDQVSALVNKLGNIAATIFPFNLPINIYECWNAAKTQELPDELNWLAITDENNNVYIPIPPLLNGSSTTTQMLIWGDDVFIPEGSTTALWFGRFKLLTKYGIQAATILMFWLFGQTVIALIWPKNKEEE